MKVTFSVTKKQKSFIDAKESEVLFGGAAGGGKSYGQVVDALLFAMRYPSSKQLILRRTFSELEKSLIRVALEVFPRKLYKFNQSNHTCRFTNGSCIDFGYCALESDVYQYQSAEYDCVRFDELTHFTERQYLYLISRVRGANSFPKQVKSSTNPGGVGHVWVKKRFVDPAPPDTPFEGDDGLMRRFIPALLKDNGFLTKKDRSYEQRLLALPESERRALLYGDWDIFEGQYFSEFDRRIHVIEPFEIPAEWRRYRSIDYGLDCLAVMWLAISPEGDSFLYRELCRKDMPIGAAAKAILQYTTPKENVYATLAPHDLFARVQESGRTKAGIFAENGVNLTKTSSDRESGWLSLKELLCRETGKGALRIFSTCTEIIRCLPALTRDKLRPTDCSTEPHEITHAPDALRGFAVYYTRPSEKAEAKKRRRWTEDMWEDYRQADEEGRNYLTKKYGEPN